MKRIIGVLTAVIIAGAVSLSCEKEDTNPEYPFAIHVKTYYDSLSVNNCHVRVFAPLAHGQSVVFEGYTDEEGKVRFKYDREAVFIVRATRGSDPPTYIGCNTIRLEPNEEVVQYVYLRAYDPAEHGQGCTLD